MSLLYKILAAGILVLIFASCTVPVKLTGMPKIEMKEVKKKKEPVGIMIASNVGGYQAIDQGFVTMKAGQSRQIFSLNEGVDPSVDSWFLVMIHVGPRLNGEETPIVMMHSDGDTVMLLRRNADREATYHWLLMKKRELPPLLIPEPEMPETPEPEPKKPEPGNPK